ncbi:MAG: hypothetical protein IJD45_01680 [Clostridia bacterium]|nr:hypothetical protein [Clostridia bacterium]
MNYSKPIKKADDNSKSFIMECLSGEDTHGIDVDSLYYYEDCWYVFEYLKCDTISPYKSDPKFYPWNWRKFYSLYFLANSLKGRLFLVNYSNRDEDNDKDKVKVMEVIDFDYKKARSYKKNVDITPYEYMELKNYEMTRVEFADWLKKINKKAQLPEL